VREGWWDGEDASERSVDRAVSWPTIVVVLTGSGLALVLSGLLVAAIEQCIGGVFAGVRL